MDKARNAALKILYEVEKNKAYMNLALEKSGRETEFDQRTNGFINEIVRGVVRNKRNLDFIVESYSKIKLKKISPWIINILRMGLYQIFFMDRVPESAAVNESVTLARRYGHGSSAGFVNALLRKAIKEGMPSLPNDEIKALGIKYSYPDWMVEKFVSEYGYVRAEAILAAGNTVPPVVIRTNILKITPEELHKKLGDKVVARNGVMLEVSGMGRIDTMPEFREGLFTVQASPFNEAAELLGPEEGMTVLDACSAPGGKTTNIAELMNNKGKIFAFDIFEHKLRLIESSALRLGIDIIHTEIHDATEEFPDLEKKCDRVLLDVPCSGLGIIRRKPDIKWNREETLEFTAVQKKILESASKTLKRGGILVYSTCTLNRCENEDVVLDFLKSHDDFEMLPFEGGEEGYKTWYPDTDGTDGAFICRMVRK